MAHSDVINEIMHKSEYLNNYLSNAPYWLIESLCVVKKPKDKLIVEENAKADTIYILVDGTVRAVDYRIKGVAYDYMWFYAVEVFGSMELFFNIPKYMTTLKTVTDCTFLVLSREQYRRWIWDDKNALQLEVGSMGKYLLEQNRAGRVFLFLQGMDRILYMFVLEYESHKNRKSMVINASRQEIAERSGLSIKTVNRAVKKMEENKVCIEFESRSQNEGFARVAVSAFISQLDPTIEEIADVKTAVSEAVTNSIIHGYENDKKGIIKIEAIISGRKATIVIEDYGKGIEDIDKAREPLYTSRPDLERSGMGFTVMESFMDTLIVESKKGKGTKIIMTKKFS